MRRANADRGGATVELVLLTPLLILLALAVLAVGRVTTARLDVDGAAAQAARAASTARHANAATDIAAQMATTSLADDGISCASMTTDVDTSAFAPGGWVAVTITCDVDLTDVTGLAIPGSHTISARSVAVIDTHRGVDAS